MVNRWIGVVVVAVTAGCSSGTGPVDPLDGGDRDADGVPDDVEIALLRQYRPFWDFDPDERLFPIAVDDWAGAGGRVVPAGGGPSSEYRDSATLLEAVRSHPDGVMHPVDPPLTGSLPCPPDGPCLAGAPVYAEATPLEDRVDLVWLQYWLFYGFDEKRLSFRTLSHRGDWEHVCVLVSRGAMGIPDAAPIGVHFHHHGALEIVEDPEWVGCRIGASDCVGERHPRVYVDRGGHGSHPASGVSSLGPHRGGFPDSGGLLDTPLVPLRPHPANASRLDDDIVRDFRGRWGHDDSATTGAAPHGPLVFNHLCDHDLLRRPTLADWTPACRSSVTRPD